jgi:hypothetical protein
MVNHHFKVVSLSFGPIVKAMLTGADFDDTHTIELVTIFDEIDIPLTTIGR